MNSALRMLLTAAFLLAVLSGLIAWERTLADRETSDRQESVRISRFLDTTVFETRPIAAIRLETGPGNRFWYVLDGNIWRSLNAYGAPATASQLIPLLDRLVEASGHVQSRNPESGPSYGFDQGNTLRLSFCGEYALHDPDGDVIYAVEIGNSIPATGGSYVREYGTTEIWNIDDDLRDVLESRDDSPLPPMVDRTIVPEVWPGSHRGMNRITVERDGKLVFDLQHQDRMGPDATADPHGPAWEWVISDGERTTLAHHSQVVAYAMFLFRVEFTGLPGPLRRQELGVDQPNAAITLHAATGEQLRLQFGGMTDRGGIAVLNTFSDTIYEVPAAHLELFFPDIDMLLSPEHGTPWQPWVDM